MSEEKTPIDPKDEFVDSPQRRNFMAAVIGGASAAYAAGLGFVIFKYLTQILGFTGQPLNLIESAFDTLSNNGSIGGTGICSVQHPQPHPKL